MLLEGKVAIVTGATRGIGKEIVYNFVSQGCFVIGIYANNDKVAGEIEKKLNGSKERSVQYIKGSVDDPDFVSNTIRRIVDSYGTIDVLVNNAGVNKDELCFKMAEENWNQVMSVNFSGTYFFCQSVLPFMEEAGEGRIVNVVSVTGVTGREAQTNYGASKGAIMGLTRLLARKYNQKGINVNAIAPGMIDTEMINHVPEDKLSNFIRFTNAQRLGATKEIANNVLYLSSELSDYLTDTVLKVDGGFLR